MKSQLLGIQISLVRADSATIRFAGGDVQKKTESLVVLFFCCCRNALQQEVSSLKLTICQMKASQQEKDDYIRHLKGEVFAINDQVLQDEGIIAQSQADFMDLCAKMQQLEG